MLLLIVSASNISKTRERFITLSIPIIQLLDEDLSIIPMFASTAENLNNIHVFDKISMIVNKFNLVLED